jgi:hypothetical protein
VRFAFARERLRAVRVIETASAAELWRIHELRIFDGVRELPRAPAWRLRARPFPWGIQDAFDNTPITFWVSGELPRPGHSVEIDFGVPEAADSVAIETSPNQSALRFRLEGREEAGGWKLLDGAPVVSAAHAPLGLRRAATAELKRRGIDYILVFDSDLGSDDFRRNSDLWNLLPAGEYKEARLYQLR